MGVKRAFTISAGFAAATVLALVLPACGGSQQAAPKEQAATTQAATTQAAEQPATTQANAAASSATAALTAADLASVDTQISLGDFEAMQTLSSDIQNGRATGKVVKIDGYVSNFAKGMSYSVTEPSADGTSKIGTVFNIEGAEESAYPSDGTHVILTGKVVADDALLFTIHTLPEFVQVVE